MIKRKVEIKLSVADIEEKIKRLKAFKKNISKFTDQYVRLCINRIKNIAINNLNSRVNYKNTTDINESWVEEKIAKGWYRLKNVSDFSVVVEFGTGIVGGSLQHPIANESGYEYGAEKWTFIRDLTDKNWQHNYYDLEDVRKNPDKYLVIVGYGGYKGKSYFYDAIFDFIESGEYITIYESFFKSIIQSF